jgi:hypothetical protein
VLNTQERCERKPDYGQYKYGPFVNAIFNRLNCIWSGGDGCPTGMKVNANIHLTVQGGAGERKALRGNTIPSNVIEWLTTAQTCAVAVTLIPLMWKWITPNNHPVSHGTLLVVDHKRKTYQLFDPWDGCMNVLDCTLPNNTLCLDRYKLIKESPSFFEGYTPPCQVKRQTNPTLQAVIERKEKVDPYNPVQMVPNGICAALGALVFIMCHRFQWYNPWRIAACIRDRFNLLNKTHKEMFRTNLYNWYRSIVTATNWYQVERRVCIIKPPIRPYRKCLVYHPNCTMCMEQSEDNHLYCPRHMRELIVQQWKGTRIDHLNDTNLPIATWLGWRIQHPNKMEDTVARPTAKPPRHGGPM